jgi:hypothetical protein
MSLSTTDIKAIVSEITEQAKSWPASQVENDLKDFTFGVLSRVKNLEKSVPHVYTQTTADFLLTCKELIDRPKELLPGQGISFSIARKATLAGVSSQVLGGAPVIAGLPIVPTPVRSLIPTVQTSAGAIQVVRKTGYTAAAAAVAEGAPKPVASATVTVTAVPVQKIAALMKLTKETFEDLPALVSELQNELIGDINKAEEAELLNGSGVSPHLTGLYPAAPALASVPPTTTYIDQIGQGIGTLINLGYSPTGVVVSGTDWQASKMEKLTSGEYLFGSPSQAVPDRIWSLPVAVSSVLTAGQWLVGDFPKGSVLYEREAVNIVIATQNATDFESNLVTALAELREVLVIKQVQAFIKNGTVAASTARK